MSDLNLSYGVTLEAYGKIEPLLTRPLTLGGVRRRPTRGETIQAMDLDDIGARGPVWSRAKVARS